MRRTFVSLAVSGIALFSSASAFAETIVANDSVDSDFNGTTSSAELIEGEMYEAVFDIPESWLPVQMLGVRVVMVQGQQTGADYCAQFGLEVWEEGNNPKQTANCFIADVDYKDPGMNLFSQQSVIDPMTGTPYGFEVVGDPNRGNATFKDLRFSTINAIPGVTINPVMLNTTRVRVGLRAQSDQCAAGGNIRQGYFPILLSDMDGVSKPLQNFIYGEPLIDSDFDGVGDTPICSASGAQHYDWEDFGPAFSGSQPGDWVMKLILNRDEPVVDPDMGMGGDMGSSDMGSGGADFGSNEIDAGGEPDAGSGSDLGNGGGSNNDNNNGNNNGNAGALAIESITPDEGPTDASTSVVILGDGFEAGAEVLLGSDAIGVVETRSGRIRATVPEGFEVGAYDVIVTNPDGSSAILRDAYAVTEPGTPTNGGSGSRGSASDGCCSQVRGAQSSSGRGLGILFALLGFLWVSRRRDD